MSRGPLWQLWNTCERSLACFHLPELLPHSLRWMYPIEAIAASKSQRHCYRYPTQGRVLRFARQTQMSGPVSHFSWQQSIAFPFKLPPSNFNLPKSRGPTATMLGSHPRDDGSIPSGTTSPRYANRQSGEPIRQSTQQPECLQVRLLLWALKRKNNMGRSSNGKTSVLQAENRGSIPRCSTFQKR